VESGVGESDADALGDGVASAAFAHGRASSSHTATPTTATNRIAATRVTNLRRRYTAAE
jgi:hypothetical protein